MHRTLLAALFLTAFGFAAAPAGEDIMPMMGGDYHSEILEPRMVGPTRRATSADSAPTGAPVAPPKLHRNMVTLKLPSLGVKGESRLRLVDIEEQGQDGSISFVPAESPMRLGEAEIPGLVVPEILAIDKYRLHDPDPVRPAPEFIERQTVALDSLSSEPWPGAAPLADAEDMSSDLVGATPGAMRRLDSINRSSRQNVAFSRIELPSPVTVPAVAAPAKPVESGNVGSLRPPENAPRTITTASGETLIRPDNIDTFDLRPASVEPTYDVVPELPPSLEPLPEYNWEANRNLMPVGTGQVNIPGAGAVMRGRRVNVPGFSQGGSTERRREPEGFTSMRELKSVLGPLYRED